MNLNVGCGYLTDPKFINVDIDFRARPDVVLDGNVTLPFRDEIFDSIYAAHILEHLDNWRGAMIEFHRVLKPEGELTIRVPLFPSRLCYADPTHKVVFCIDSMDLFLSPRLMPGKTQPTDTSGLFEQKKPALFWQNTVGKTNDDWMQKEMNIPYVWEMTWFLVKKTREYWIEQRAHENLLAQPLGCIYCHWKLDGPTCPNPDCGVVHTWIA